MDRNEKIKYIAEYFGLAQEQKIIEEAGELITELSRLQQQVMLVALGKAETDDREIKRMMNDVILEMVDVDILIHQLIHIYDAEDEFEEGLDYKLDRTIRRIENGYYK